MNISPALPSFPPLSPPAREQLAGDNQQRPAVTQPEPTQGEHGTESQAEGKRDDVQQGVNQRSSHEEIQALEELQRLERRDQEVRVHEQAHAAIGGRYAGTPSYEYERGSNGKSYAVAGEVQIDVSVVEGNPQATIEKMAVVRRAALAPAQPSSADRAIAAEASQKEAQARAELNQQDSKPKSSRQTEPSTEAEDKDSDEEKSVAASETTQRVVEAKYQRATSPSVDSGFQVVA